VARTAMKAPTKKSALEGVPTVAHTTDIANEILNEMQRDRGGATVTEDESRYQVTIRLPGAKDVPDWTGEVIGPPALFPLETVNVLTAGKSLMVFDQQNKKLWAETLSYPVGGVSGAPDEADAAYGRGPCVERGNRLYVFDQGTLSAFDLKTGNAQRRLPSVGITGLFFDDAGMLYVNTTTASHESLKYSRQIDVSQKTSGSVIKVDPQTGKTLWVTQTAGMISYLSGKFIYSVQSYRPLDEDDDNPYTVETGFETKPYLQIRRINPRNGHQMWEHFEQRAPLDVRFDKNSIQVVFKKEVEVLKYLTF
jgi:outer membrane protein assembly factor BamB